MATKKTELVNSTPNPHIEQYCEYRKKRKNADLFTSHMYIRPSTLEYVRKCKTPPNPRSITPNKGVVVKSVKKETPNQAILRLKTEEIKTHKKRSEN
jgi:hypothetical protein